MLKNILSFPSEALMTETQRLEKKNLSLSPDGHNFLPMEREREREKEKVRFVSFAIVPIYCY